MPIQSFHCQIMAHFAELELRYRDELAGRFHWQGPSSTIYINAVFTAVKTEHDQYLTLNQSEFSKHHDREAVLALVRRTPDDHSSLFYPCFSQYALSWRQPSIASLFVAYSQLWAPMCYSIWLLHNKSGKDTWRNVVSRNFVDRFIPPPL